MENWGLIFHSQETLLRSNFTYYNDEKTERKWICSVVAHEVCVLNKEGELEEDILVLSDLLKNEQNRLRMIIKNSGVKFQPCRQNIRNNKF